MRDRTGAPQGRLLHMAVIVAHQSQVGRLRENALSLWTPPLPIPLQLASMPHAPAQRETPANPHYRFSS